MTPKQMTETAVAFVTHEHLKIWMLVRHKSKGANDKTRHTATLLSFEFLFISTCIDRHTVTLPTLSAIAAASVWA